MITAKPVEITRPSSFQLFRLYSSQYGRRKAAAGDSFFLSTGAISTAHTLSRGIPGHPAFAVAQVRSLPDINPPR